VQQRVSCFPAALWISLNNEKLIDQTLQTAARASSHQRLTGRTTISATWT
jgi:hypothetical protein